MPFPFGPAVLQNIHGTNRRQKILYQDFAWTNGTIRIDVPEGYLTDGASIPVFFKRVIGDPWAEYLCAAIIHDWIYSDGHLTEHFHLSKKQTDILFLEIMEELDVSKVKRKLMYRAVRLFGRGWWGKKDEA